MPPPVRRAPPGIDEAAHAALLEGIPSSALWSLLLDVFSARATRRAPSELVAQWERDTFTCICSVDQRTLAELDVHLLATAARFEAVELSPLAPLGACSAMGRASQNKIVSALRGTEVVADPTNVFALECARRLRADPDAIVRLATSHRCVRAQPVPDKPGFAQHFRIFCLGSAALERKDHAFVVEALAEHVATHLAILDRLEAHGYAFPERRVRVLATERRAQLGDRLAEAIRGTEVTRLPLEHAYYDGLRFMIDVGNGGGNVPLIDGGAFDWVAKLASNRRLVFVASGMGAQLLPLLFRAPTLPREP
jgi:hypothetical protein